MRIAARKDLSVAIYQFNRRAYLYLLLGEYLYPRSADLLLCLV